jgi:hypothetical protein
VSAHTLTAVQLAALRREADAITAAVAERPIPHFRVPNPADADRVRADLDGYQAAVTDADRLLADMNREEENRG